MNSMSTLVTEFQTGPLLEKNSSLTELLANPLNISSLGLENSNTSSLSIEEHVEKGLFEYIEGFYRELQNKYSAVKHRAFTVLDDNAYYCLLYFPDANSEVSYSEVDLEKHSLILHKAKEQPCLCSLYELRFYTKGDKFTKKNSQPIGYIVVASKAKIFALTEDTLYLEDQTIATALDAEQEKESNIKSMKVVDETVAVKKVKQIIEVLPSLYSFFNKERSRELLLFDATSTKG